MLVSRFSWHDVEYNACLTSVIRWVCCWHLLLTFNIFIFVKHHVFYAFVMQIISNGI